MKKIILNQKSYLLYDEIIDFKKSFDKIAKDDYEFILFPSILYLTEFRNSNYGIGTQNFYSNKTGSYTGEVNLESLKDIGVTYTLLGQYERKKILLETKEEIKEKLFKSINSKFNTLLCLGESKKSRRPFMHIKRDINYYLKSIEKNNLKYLSIIYEPNSAIGNDNIDINVLSKTIERIKSYIKSKYSINLEVYYAGQLNDNIKSIINICDGIVLGKQSTDINEIKKILKEIK